jgi:hypothetical protein
MSKVINIHSAVQFLQSSLRSIHHELQDEFPVIIYTLFEELECLDGVLELETCGDELVDIGKEARGEECKSVRVAVARMLEQSYNLGV